MLSELFRTRISSILTPVAKRIPLHPNVISMLGLVASIISIYTFAIGAFRMSALLVLLSGLFDLLDGSSARARKLDNTKFGAFFDSALDRFSDSAYYFGIFLYYLASDSFNVTGVILAFLAITGSNIASYLKAESELHGFQCNVGIVKRQERMVLLILGGFLGENYFIYILWILTLFAFESVFHRLIYIRSGLKRII